MTMEKLVLSGTDWQLKEFVGLDWVWRDSEKPDTKDTRWWLPAAVPGSVLDDLTRAGKTPDPYYELNSKQCEWAAARTWVYRKSFAVSACQLVQRATLHLDGIDYSAAIYLNGEHIGSHTGMYTPCVLDVTDKLLAGDNLLAVVLEPAPPEQPQVGKTSLTNTHKSRMTYWWDFCPRLVHQGIWDDVYVEFTGPARLRDCFVRSLLDEDCGRAVVTVTAECDRDQNALLEVDFAGKTRQAVFCDGSAEISFELNNPRLWQPNGCGEPYEYDVELRLLRDGVLSHSKRQQFGIRRLDWTSNTGREQNQPYLLRVNNRELFIRGSNWVPIDVLYGPRREKKLKRLIELAKASGINMLRVWGGGLIEREDFYRLCAESGIMVWQEFILSSSGIDNKTPADPAFISFMEEEARVIIRKRRGETALAVWCGGNELQSDDGMPLTCADPLLAVLEQTVAQEDGDRRFLPTSPYGGLFMNSLQNIESSPERLCDVHGPWEHQGLESHYRLYNAGSCQLHSEFGVEGMTNRHALESTIAPEHRLPAGKDNEIYFHRGAWWTNDALVNSIFHNPETADKMRMASQYMQYEGLKYALERDRSRMPVCSGTFPWQFNEPYPNAYCTSNVDYYGQPKPVYYGVKRAYSPYQAVARFGSAALCGAEELVAELQLLSPAVCTAVTLEWGVYSMSGARLGGGAVELQTDGRYTTGAGELRCRHGQSEGLLLLRLSVRTGLGEALCTNEYTFAVGDSLASMLCQPTAALHAAWQGDSLCLRNNGGCAALWVNLTACTDVQDGSIYLSENYFVLLPGEQRRLIVRRDGAANGELELEGFNVSLQTVSLMGFDKND